MDLIFLPVSSFTSDKFLMGYRHFELGEIRQFLDQDPSLLVSIVIDGPFQRRVRKMGLESLLRQWRIEGPLRILQEEATEVGKLIAACINCRPDALVIADDIAYRDTTYIKPSALERSLFKFYQNWTRLAHAQGVQALFHSDGNLSGVVSHLLTYDLDGFAGLELECQDIPTLKRKYDSTTLLSGIPGRFLEEELNRAHQEEFVKLLTSLAPWRRFGLCSSCGLSSVKQLSQLQTLYRWADEAELGWRVKNTG